MLERLSLNDKARRHYFAVAKVKRSIRGQLFIVLAAVLFLCSSKAYADTWARTYGGESYDYASSIQQTLDGGYIVAGTTRSFGTTGQKFWVLKLKSNGDIDWERAYGGTSGDNASSIQQTLDGGYIVAGTTWSFGAGSSDFWVLKLKSNGDIDWERAYGGTEDDSAAAIQQTLDGGYIVAGTTRSFGTTGQKFWVLKLRSNGDIDWQKAYGGASWHQASSIQQTLDGGYIVAGINYYSHYHAYWVVKLKSNGDIDWEKTYSGATYHQDPAFQQTRDGGYIVACTRRSFGAGSSDFLVLKLKSNGDIEWQKAYGGESHDDASSIQQTRDGGYIVAGTTGSFGAGSYDFWVLKLDESGSILRCPHVKVSNASPITTDYLVLERSASDTTIDPVTTTASFIDTISPEVALECPRPDIPPKPTGFSLQPSIKGRITLSWNAMTNIDKFIIKRTRSDAIPRKRSDTGLTETWEVAGDATVYIAAQLPCFVYSYKLYAVRGGQQSRPAGPLSYLYDDNSCFK